MRKANFFVDNELLKTLLLVLELAGHE